MVQIEGGLPMKKIGAVLIAFFALCFTLITTATEASAEMYVVNKGDNLWRIAEDFNTTTDNIIRLNKLDSTVIFPKQELDLYETYEVEKGDTLYWLAKEYETTVDELMELNDLSSDLIIIGQELKVNKNSKNTTTKSKTVAKRQTKKQSTESKQENTNETPEGRTMTVTATAYTAECDGCSGITYTGVNLLNDRNAKVIAVDPNVIPLGSSVYVEGYGYATAEDIGGAIKGNRIDIHLPTKTEAYNWGVRDVKITILE